MDEIGRRPQINLFEYVMDFFVQIENLMIDLKTYGLLFLNLYEEIKIIEAKRIEATQQFINEFINLHTTTFNQNYSPFANTIQQLKSINVEEELTDLNDINNLFAENESKIILRGQKK